MKMMSFATLLLTNRMRLEFTKEKTRGEKKEKQQKIFLFVSSRSLVIVVFRTTIIRLSLYDGST